MSNTTKNISYSVALEKSPISSVLVPEIAQVIAGQSVVFTTQGSESYDGSALTITWSVETPVGSSVLGLDVSSDTVEARLYPDVNGTYKVTAVATNLSGARSINVSYVLVSSVEIPLNREKPDITYIGNSISSFWAVLNNKEVISSLWSEYVKILSGDYRKAAEVVLSKSIDNIQPGRIVSNYVFSPELDLEGFNSEIRITKSFCGTRTASTTVKNFLFHALVLNSQTVLLLQSDGKFLEGITQESILHIYSSDTDLSGEYNIKSANATALHISSLTPVIKTTVTGNIQISTTIDSDMVFSTSTLTAGTYIKFNGDYYKVTVSTNSANYAKLDRPIKTTKVTYVAVHTPVVVSIEPEEIGLTDKIYVRSSELGGFNKFKQTSKNRSLMFTNPITFIAPQDMGSIDVNSTIKLMSSRYTGIKTKIVDLYYDETQDAAVFTVSPAIPVPLDNFDPTFLVNTKISRDSTLKGVLFTSGRLSCPIKSISYFKDYQDVGFVQLQVTDKTFPQNMANMDWRVSSTITSVSLSNSIDYQKEGVSAGDLLEIEISSSIVKQRTILQFTIIGAYKNSISFEPTNKALIDDTGSLVKPSVQDKDVYDVFTTLNIPTALKQSDNTYLFSSIAKTIKGSIQNSLNRVYYSKLKLETFTIQGSTPLNTIYITESTAQESVSRIGIKPKRILRNTTFPIKIDEPVASIPAITEFIYPKLSSSVEDSTQIAIQSKDNSVEYRDRNEQQLLENVSFFIKNNTAFSGTSLTKTKGLLVEDEFGFFIDRGVNTGDTIVIDGVTYTIKTVLNSTTIEILKDTNTTLLENTAFINKTYSIQTKNSYNYPYIQMRSGIYSVDNPIPTRLFAQTIVIDNVKQVENNFGVLVGYTVKDFYDFSSPQMSYLNAIRGLMYAITNGPTIYNIQLATAILLNLPVSQRYSVVKDIDMQNGRFVLQPVNEITLEEIDSPEYYTFSTVETIEPFREIGYSRLTGEKFKIGDIVEKFTPLTSKVYIEDFTQKPFQFITQFHKWKIHIDANSISSRDLPLLAKFYSYAKPIHTLPTLELLLFLVTEVAVLTKIQMDGLIMFYDDPALGLELTHISDSTNQSGQHLRLFDKGELSTRTLFLGKDLLIASSTEASSQRGGFLLNSASDFTDDPGLGVDNDVKEIDASSPFTGTHFARGRNLVRSGDILRIYSGINKGIFEITQVPSDATLEIAPLPDYGIYTKTPEVSTTKAVFGIYRLVKDIIVSDITCAAKTGSVVTFTGTTLNWDGVAVGDILVANTNHSLKYPILDVEYDPITEDAATRLTVDTTIAGPQTGIQYFIYRPLLIPRISNTGTVSSYTSADPRHVEHNLTDSYKIEVGDQFVLTNGTLQEQYAAITHVRHSSFEISNELPLSSSSTFEIRKLGRPLEENSDQRLEKLHGYDDVAITLTSATAIATATALANTPSALAVKEISGITSLPNPCDKIYLYDNSNVLLFEGTVYYQKTSSVVCISHIDNIADHSLSYIIKIERRSRA